MVRLWRHVIEALVKVAPKEGFGADALVGLGVVGAKLLERVLPGLINELVELPHPVVIVLDDYHCIEDNACHESVVTDPPPYRDNASLRGPEHLFVEFDSLR